MRTIEDFKNRDYWIIENAQYEKPSFRLRKCAKIVNTIAADRKCTLLDVGCGPGSLLRLLRPNVEYYGIDIAIHHPAPYLREADLAHQPIDFEGKRFDFVVAMGLFEYLGAQHDAKLEEIREILKDNGKFILSYINFGHMRRLVWPNYNNIRQVAQMVQSLNRVFRVERYFPASHHWRQKQPGKNCLPGLQMHINYRIPLLSSLCAVEYFFICSHRNEKTTA